MMQLRSTEKMVISTCDGHTFEWLKKQGAYLRQCVCIDPVIGSDDRGGVCHTIF